MVNQRLNREQREEKRRAHVRTNTLQDSLPTRANHARVRGLSAVAKGNERIWSGYGGVMIVQHSLDAGAGAARSGMHAAAGRSGWALMLRRCQGVVKGQ